LPFFLVSDPFLSETGKLTKGLNSFDRSKISLRSDYSFFYGIKGKFEYLSITICGSLKGLTEELSKSHESFVFLRSLGVNSLGDSEFSYFAPSFAF